MKLSYLRVGFSGISFKASIKFKETTKTNTQQKTKKQNQNTNKHKQKQKQNKNRNNIKKSQGLEIKMQSIETF